ncbi:hypothetical protein Rsub_04450 [Raphidocelis subcapitata]|uniref:glutathione transferase n=1 Tax=Raphidocelis subcapitata TaxID=307507 RepID=A0A2V0P2M9_9CHLO|nr:hypothetical protein Rsub_04450 [Raphidocelis subcapitata]|eukprot:GBF92103.1 hypothetical protein Rsub_04450 [Raphidocelis subcapitata]
MTFTIYYFPIRGRAEVAKLVCAYAKEPWKLVEHSYEEQKNDLDTWPFGQSPRAVDEDSGANIVQSNAIIRHLARKHKLYGANEEEMTKVDILLDAVEDLRMKYVPLIYVGKLEPKAKEEYWKTHGDKAGINGRNGGAHFEYLERLLKKAGGTWFVGPAPTAADLAVYDIIHLHLRDQLFPEEMKAQYPGLVAHHDRVEALPGVKEYLASPDRLAAPNNNGLG